MSIAGIGLVLSLAAAVAASCLALLFAIGASNSRFEDEYWHRFWQETPTTDSARLGMSLQANQVCDESGTQDLRQAA